MIPLDRHQEHRVYRYLYKLFSFLSPEEGYAFSYLEVKLRKKFPFLKTKEQVEFRVANYMLSSEERLVLMNDPEDTLYIVRY